MHYVITIYFEVRNRPQLKGSVLESTGKLVGDRIWCKAKCILQ